MNLSQRQQQLLQRIQRQGFATVEELATHFQVTPQTIRRDINFLCNKGLLSRYHGGAGLPQSSVENIAYPARQVLNLDAKRRIAARVAEHVPHSASLFINIGTTNEEIAKALLQHRDLKVITNNLNVASILCDNPSCEVIVAGGLVRRRDRGVIGEATIDFIRQFKVDFGIIGISGIDPDGSLMDFDYREVRVAQQIIAQSRRVLLAADTSKFDRNPLVRLGRLQQIDALFTDQPVPAALLPLFEAAGTKIYQAKDQALEATPSK